MHTGMECMRHKGCTDCNPFGGAYKGKRNCCTMPALYYIYWNSCPISCITHAHRRWHALGLITHAIEHATMPRDVYGRSQNHLGNLQPLFLAMIMWAKNCKIMHATQSMGFMPHTFMVALEYGGQLVSSFAVKLLLVLASVIMTFEIGHVRTSPCLLSGRFDKLQLAPLWWTGWTFLAHINPWINLQIKDGSKCGCNAKVWW